MAPAVVNWPWVPNSKSALLPTASRMRLQNLSDSSIRSRLGMCGSNAV
jgi:hypothetical protein